MVVDDSAEGDLALAETDAAYRLSTSAATLVVDSYTDLVGKPFMPPIYGLELGDADCYLHNANRGERRTLDALKIAQGYVDNGMPNGWMLVNDGYGCGYENLPEVAKGLQDRNMQVGLWTESALDKQAEEVAAGVRVRKLRRDVPRPPYQLRLQLDQRSTR